MRSAQVRVLIAPVGEDRRPEARIPQAVVEFTVGEPIAVSARTFLMTPPMQLSPIGPGFAWPLSGMNVFSPPLR